MDKFFLSTFRAPLSDINANERIYRTPSVTLFVESDAVEHFLARAVLILGNAHVDAAPTNRE